MADEITHPWTVVVIGRWNRAIFSPAWIGKHIFKLPEGTKIQVQISFDGHAPVRYRHDDFIVSVDSDKLHFETTVSDYAHLRTMSEMAVSVLQELPSTPCMAAGYNITIDGNPAIAKSVEWYGDDALKKADCKIIIKGIGRVMEWRFGRLTINIQDGENRFVGFNFERSSTSTSDLVEWLKTDVEDLHAEVDRLLPLVLNQESQ